MYHVMTHNSTVNLKLTQFLLWTKGSYQSSNFDTLECSGENLQNFSCHFPSNNSVFLHILHHSSVSWKITPLYFFSSKNTYFAQKEPIKVKIFETFECSGQKLSNFLCQFWSDKSIPLQILYISSVSWKIIPLYFFSSNSIYFAQKEPIKMKIFKTLSAWVKFCQIPYANFETTSWFLYKFCIPLYFHDRLLLCSFLARTIYTLLNRSPIKWKFFRLFSTRVKFCEIPYASFEVTSRFLSKCWISLQFY